MMQTSVLLLVAFVAFVSAGHHMKQKSPEHRACFQVLKTREDKKEIKEMKKRCIAQQDGLQDIIDDLECKNEDLQGDQVRGRKRKGFYRFMQLEEHANKVLALRKCMVTKFGYVNEDDSFNIAKLKSEVLASVAGSEWEVNTKLGLESCSTDSLKTYDVMQYLKCLVNYCATGTPTSQKQ
ncbi:hypothetical protein FHG87_005903 [Trinorchestia longiramus]|nr:hypothetical protein FHG87_005903 [Trinorchestia longiramus]